MAKVELDVAEMVEETFENLDPKKYVKRWSEFPTTPYLIKHQ